MLHVLFVIACSVLAFCATIMFFSELSWYVRVQFVGGLVHFRIGRLGGSFYWSAKEIPTRNNWRPLSLYLPRWML